MMQKAAGLPRIDVIVRTRADATRAALLFRALDSIRRQARVDARAIVVANGPDPDPDVLERLRARPDVLLHHEQQASAAIARIAGRRLVTAPYFAYLDDDDELIDGALREPVAWLEEHPSTGVFVGNGYFIRDRQPPALCTDIERHLADPGLTLMDECWLQPGAFVAGTSRTGKGLFDTPWTHMEWTKIAMELCVRGVSVHFMDIPMVRYNDTPGSMSKQLSQDEAGLALIRSFVDDERIRGDVRRRAREKLLAACHNLAASYWRKGRVAAAWRCHLASLRPPATFRYLLFSRKLLLPWIRHV